MINQHLERLELVSPIIRQPVQRLFDLCEEKLKRKLLLVTGFRSVNEQLLKYAQGRTFNRESGDWEVTNAKEVITNAKPGRSAHNLVTQAGVPASLAVDVIPFDGRGYVDWTPGETFWEALYEIAWKVGLDPLGDPIGAYLAGDMGHFEEPGYTYKLDGLGLVQPTSEIQRV